MPATLQRFAPVLIRLEHWRKIEPPGPSPPTTRPKFGIRRKACANSSDLPPPDLPPPRPPCSSDSATAVTLSAINQTPTLLRTNRAPDSRPTRQLVVSQIAQI